MNIKKIVIVILTCFSMVLLLVGCNKSTELGPQEVTDTFLSELFKVNDYKLVNATSEDDISQIAKNKLAPLEPYTAQSVLENIMADRTNYFIEAEAEKLNGKGKWVLIKSEARDQTEESCTVWYEGEFVILVEGKPDVKYPITGTALLKHDESGWKIHGNKFISFPLGK